MNILFRADSSFTIGTGHIMRDLVLAKSFENANITFATQNLEGHINHKIIREGYALEILDSDEIKVLIALIKKLDIDILVIDHYGIDYHDEKRLKGQTGVKLFVLDDTYEKHYCDILLNHNVSADRDRYEGLVPKGCELRCGAKYTLLRDEFIMIEKRDRSIASTPLKVLLAMGGADNANLNIKILEALEAFSLSIMIVTTTANKHLEELKTYVKDSKHITLYINSNEVAKLMNEADFAIITPSVTVNEAMYMQLPFIAIQTADNQKEIAMYLKNKNFKVLLSFDENQLSNYVKNFVEAYK